MNTNIQALLNEISNEGIEVLKRVYIQLYPNRTDKQVSKMKQDTLINKIGEHSEADIKDAYDIVTGKTLIPKQEVVQQKVTTQNIAVTNPEVALTLSQADAQRALNEVYRQIKQDQEELIDVTITPRFPTKMNGRDKVEAVTIHNQFGSIGKIVPFGIACELPKCIVEYFQNAKCIQVADIQQSRPFIAGNTEGTITSMTDYGWVPKYNVLIHPRGTVRAEIERNKQEQVRQPL